MVQHRSGDAMATGAFFLGGFGLTILGLGYIASGVRSFDYDKIKSGYAFAFGGSSTIAGMAACYIALSQD
jgi:hypothetical protein